MILPEELTGIQFLENLGADHLNRIAKLARLEDHVQGTVLFREGEPTPCIYFVLSGQVGLEVMQPDGEPVEVCTIAPGELLGWSPVLGGPAMTATARTLARCRLAVLDVKMVLELCEREPHFGLAFLRQVALVLSARLHETRRCLALARVVNNRSLIGNPA